MADVEKKKKKSKVDAVDKKEKKRGSGIQMVSGIVNSAAKPFSNFGDIESETNTSPYFGQLTDRFSDSTRTFGDRIAYTIENRISADNNVKFYVLIYLSVFFFIVFSVLWHFVSRGDDVHGYSIGGIAFMMFQVLISVGYDDSIVETDERIIYVMCCAVGVTLIAILIGLITDSVNGYMESMSVGSTKVAEKGHTLLIGWNEASVRVVCQIAFLRHTLLSQNQSWSKYFFPWLKVLPSTPVANAPVIILTMMDKGELEDIIRNAFEERNVDPKYTMVGRDVVVRQGDPSNAHALVRMAAQDATSIIVMVNEDDLAEQELSEGTADNSATIRTVLALRNVVYSNGQISDTFPKDMRVVVQLSKPCPFLHATTFLDPAGQNVLFPQELTRTINALLFYCAAKPGLSRIIMSLLDFQGASIRCRPAHWLRGGPNNEVGWCVGKTMREVLMENCWDNAICLGCDDKRTSELSNDSDDKQSSSSGIMSDPERVLKPTDTILFVSKSSTPRVGPKYRFEKKLDTLSLGEEVRSSLAVKRVLLCGWRQIWDDEPIRVKILLAELFSGLGPGSTVTFATRKPRDAFVDLFMGADIGFTQQGEDFAIEGPVFKGLTIHHYHCDPVKMKDMEGLFDLRTFDTAIVLGTAAGLDMPAASRDSRVLSILLILRALSHEHGYSLHVVAENQQDQTATLAVTPRNNGYDPDFVNTQAIIARTLVMNLAYPEIQDAISELITNHSKSAPNFNILEPQNLGLLGKKCNLGMIQHILARKFHNRAVGLGWFQGTEMVICPSFKKMVEFTSEHRIIAIIRVASKNSLPSPSSRNRKTSVEFDPSQYEDVSTTL